jgi:hypothetical protein
MKKALIDSDGCRVAMIVEEGEEFPVAPELKWVDVEADVTDRYTYEGKKFIPPKVSPPPSTTWKGKTINEITDDEAIVWTKGRMIRQGI